MSNIFKNVPESRDSCKTSIEVELNVVVNVDEDGYGCRFKGKYRWRLIYVDGQKQAHLFLLTTISYLPFW